VGSSRDPIAEATRRAERDPPPPGDAEYRKRKDFRHDRHVRMKEAAN
jgi:hypothetical protein